MKKKKNVLTNFQKEAVILHYCACCDVTGDNFTFQLNCNSAVFCSELSAKMCYKHSRFPQNKMKVKHSTKCIRVNCSLKTNWKY